MDDVKLSHHARKWVENAILNSDKKSLKLVRKQAHSLARKKYMKEQLQLGKWEGYRLLDYAVRHGHEILLTLLIEEFNADPNFQDPLNGISALHHAAATGQIKMMETLVKKYVCDTEAKAFGNSTPMCFAISHAQNDSLRMLLKFGASVEVESFLGTPIFLAAYHGNIDAVRTLHEANPDVVNSELYGFCTPLVVAASKDSTDCFKYLVEAADISAKHLMYKIVCYSDSEQRSLERIDILLKRGLSPNFFDEYLYEELPILCAAKKGWKNVIDVLLTTNQIPGIEWSVGGVIQYVNSEGFFELYHEERENRINVLKERMFSEIHSKNYLATDIICKALYVDMDREQWEWYRSLCKLLIIYGLQSMFPECNINTFVYMGMILLKDDNDEDALLAAKACMALDPEDELVKTFYVQVQEKGRAASCSGRT